MTSTTTTTTTPRRPALDRAVAMRLAATEYERFLAALRELSDEDWHRPTVNTGWDVHAMVCHTLGMTEMAASVPEQLRQMRTASKTKGDGPFIDALTALQVRKHVHRSPAELVTRFAAVGPKAARGRRRTPALIRGRRIGDQPVDDHGTTEPWTLGYLVDVILTRDPWMHRSDLAEATGRPMTLTADHDGVLVADVAAEWAARHGRPCTLTLTGPAGGTWTFAGGGEPLELDAVEFCRILSGRPEGSGLLATRVPF
ncbi:MAG TPA: maleylpyruvate isomerase family mycothiol-dependent enzyme [Mycobacteriales bacterium]|nr:maleylpyruvate isomerase family mycothiol-dependent enzyme [Mycobacteriales bacterium]